MKKLPLLVLIALIIIGLIGGGSSSADQITPEEKVTIAQFELDSAQTVYDGSGYGGLLNSVDVAISIARQKPDAVYVSSKGSRTMRQVLADNSANLQPYRPEIAKQLELAVHTLPPVK